MEELELMRRQIDEIDEKLVELFENRMELVQKIGEIKAQNGLSIQDPKREEEVIKKAIDRLKDKDMAGELEAFFHFIMDSAKRRQLSARYKGY